MQPELSQRDHTPLGVEPILPSEQDIWWEKTIEYLFVSKHLNHYEFAMPLAGNHERLGDYTFAKDARWIAIEFKRGIQGISDYKGIEAMRRSEIVKFPDPQELNYKKAGEILCEKYGATDDGINHHFIVYGELDDSKLLQLKSYRYFSTPESGVAVEKTLSMGIDIDTFFDYINDFTLKKQIGMRRSPNSPLGGPDFGIAIGISSNCFTAMTMKEFIAYQRAIKEEEQNTKLQDYKNILFNDGIEPEEIISKRDVNERNKKKQDRVRTDVVYKKTSRVKLENSEAFDKIIRTSTKKNHNTNES
ncbi:hypothetical protein [Vibrio sp. Vb0349]|uniref:hypothetical protein n=1 Tax=Vibrio sp. Vb0349 TaxID=3074624 RepID=UPI0029651EB0|nr:hypothetical protein [Vibrio sp. Vb0349]MDW1916311.1 hypothetical protein [Vibrio sp. Vb0349]